ncbi:MULTISPECIES: DUF5959 family protein [Streptomycetaceae]|uniref:DUF5959 family protein n=2 Tax=Streptomycetaceae TaxID=2062 RepID=A0ABU2W1R7_9ACTN|nr:DUF5959 family protein [Streptomyces griseus]ARF73916.1 hypothetical protein B7C62_17850 [Kitasatospora albolonga]MDT0491564.1 DUF5959 family protein [Streptomyces griseus]
MELISLSDGDNSFRVRVLGRRSPGVLHLHDQLEAEVIVTSSFVSGRLAMSLLPSDLEEWSRALDLLAAGQDICWRDDDHSPEIKIQPYNEEHETAAVRVEDLGSSDVSVFLPLNLEEDWIDKQRKLLGQVLKEWPSEVLESSPGAYEWRR